MKRYFINVNTLEELRKQYKELLKKYHPDNGGSEETLIIYMAIPGKWLNWLKIML